MIECPTPWCEDWKPQMEIIDGLIRTASARAGQDLYTMAGGKPFTFCPFCGHKLRERDTEGKNEVKP